MIKEPARAELNLIIENYLEVLAEADACPEYEMMVWGINRATYIHDHNHGYFQWADPVNKKWGEAIKVFRAGTIIRIPDNIHIIGDTVYLNELLIGVIGPLCPDGYMELITTVYADSEESRTFQGGTMKQIRLKNKILKIKDCGEECPCYNGEYENCNASEDPENTSMALVAFCCSGFPDWCQLEDAEVE
jgi:hypothetical protein